jgi:hypothetical protein
MRILHVFADRGAENPALTRYGDIPRVSLNVVPNDYSEAVQADARNLPITDDATFDIAWFHPPCGGVSPMSDTGEGSRDEWPDLIPVAREIGRKHCDHYVIENKPRESLDTEVTLTGHMFNLGIEYERAFETTFPVEQPPRQSQLAETSPFYYSEKPHEWWAGVKGSSVEFPKDHLAKNTIPAAYIDYLMRYHAEAVADDGKPDYSDYDKRMNTKRAKAANSSLSEF